MAMSISSTTTPRGFGRAVPEVDVDRLRWIVDVNLTSLITATQIVAQAMRERGGGVIVNTVSTVALGTGFHDVMYATTKAGVLMFTTACAMLKDKWNVRVAGCCRG
jgi:3-oxoacyl-[acyl-carrier protein] reductase